MKMHCCLIHGTGLEGAVFVFVLRKVRWVALGESK